MLVSQGGRLLLLAKHATVITRPRACERRDAGAAVRKLWDVPHGLRGRWGGDAVVLSAAVPLT